MCSSYTQYQVCSHSTWLGNRKSPYIRTDNNQIQIPVFC